MDAEIKAKWLDALRSGKYKQGLSALQNAGKFCCLGVLCDLVSPNDWAGADYSGDVYHDGKCNYPSEVVLNEAGLDEDESLTVASMNDEGETFEEIAYYIELNL